MKRTLLSASLLPLFAGLALACSGQDPEIPETPAPPDYLYGVEEQPFGKTYEQWAETWFQWALAIPNAENPIQEGPCEGNQMGDVFFLAGNAGGESTRACAIPAGKAIFFPIINAVSRTCPEYVDPNVTCETLTSESALHDSSSLLADGLEITTTLEIDGNAITDLDDRHAHTATFDDPTQNQADDAFGSICSGPIRDNPCNVPVGSTRIAAGDGYWAMLKPLPAGEHKVRFTGKVLVSSQEAFALDVTYNLTVAP
jgi:hypothetical protein